MSPDEAVMSATCIIGITTMVLFWGRIGPLLRLALVLQSTSAGLSLLSTSVLAASDEYSDRYDALLAETEVDDLSGAEVDSVVHTAFQLNVHSAALHEAAGPVLLLSFVATLAGIFVWLLAFILRKRLPLFTGRRPVELSETFERLLDGLAETERRASVSAAELRRVEAEKQRIRELASLTPEQLSAINKTLSPGARLGIVLTLATFVLGIVATLMASWLAGDLPWQ